MSACRVRMRVELSILGRGRRCLQGSPMSCAAATSTTRLRCIACCKDFSAAAAVYHHSSPRFSGRTDGKLSKEQTATPASPPSGLRAQACGCQVHDSRRAMEREIRALLSSAPLETAPDHEASPMYIQDGSVDFRADDEDRAKHVEEDQDDHDGSEPGIGRHVVGKIGDVGGEGVAADGPQHSVRKMPGRTSTTLRWPAGSHRCATSKPAVSMVSVRGKPQSSTAAISVSSQGNH